MTRQLTTLLDGGHFFEGPRWRDGHWWVSDFYAHHVLKIAPDGTSQVVLEIDGQPSGLGWMPDGSMLVVSMTDGKLLRQTPDGTVTEHADFSAHVGGLANDMVVDSAGRAYVGSFGFDLMAGADPAPTSLVKVDPDGTVSVAATNMLFPNGAVITPDGATLIVGETLGCRYTAFDIGADGSLSNRRVWAQLAPTPTLGSLVDTMGQIAVGPDGCGLDAHGRIWMADAFGARAALVAQGGEILDEVTAPDGLGMYACAIGGDDGNTLLICCAPDFLEHNRLSATEAVLVTVDL